MKINEIQNRFPWLLERIKNTSYLAEREKTQTAIENRTTEELDILNHNLTLLG